MSKKKDSLKPWLSRPAINRSVTLPLTRPLTQRLSNLNEFHPNELDPYLLFDARDSMIGTLENPTLDLDPSKPDTLNVITATRAGVATYTDVNGNIATASADTVRVDYVDSVPMILVEPSATNLVDYSEDFTHSSWTKSNATLTDDYGIAPDGANTSTRIQYTGGSAYIADNVSSGTYTASAFVKGVAGEVVKFGIGLNVGQGAEFTLNGEWQRIQQTGTGNIIFFSSLGGNTATDFEIWGAQLEAGSVATSYIPTSGGDAAARTRASDELVISGSDFTDFYNGSAGTFFIQAQNRTPELNGAVLMGQNSNRLFFYKSNPNRLSTYDGGSFTHHDGLVANQLFNAAVTFNTSNRSLSLDGSALDTDTINTNWAGADILKIGFGYSNNFNGHYRRIIYWPLHSDSL